MEANDAGPKPHCAGGKTLHLAALMKNRGETFAVTPQRLENLRQHAALRHSQYSRAAFAAGRRHWHLIKNLAHQELKDRKNAAKR